MSSLGDNGSENKAVVYILVVSGAGLCRAV